MRWAPGRNECVSAKWLPQGWLGSRSGSALRWREGIGHEGRRDEKRRLGAEHKGLRARGLAVGSSPLPWAHSKLAANLGPVKGLVGLDSGGVCSRGARSPSGRPTPRPGTVAPSAARRHGGGGDGGPAGSTGRPPTARRNAGARAGGTGVAAPSGGVRPKPRRPIPRGRTPRAAVRRRRRGSAPADESGFFCCDRPGCEDHFVPSKRSPCQRFCSPACRQALRRVIERERRWRQRARRAPVARPADRCRGP